MRSDRSEPEADFGNSLPSHVHCPIGLSAKLESLWLDDWQQDGIGHFELGLALLSCRHLQGPSEKIRVRNDLGLDTSVVNQNSSIDESLKSTRTGVQPAALPALRVEQQGCVEIGGPTILQCRPEN